MPFIINPRCTCAARVTVVALSVCVCRLLFWHYRLRGGLLAIPAASELRSLKNKQAIFLKRLRSRDAVKTSAVRRGFALQCFSLPVEARPPTCLSRVNALSVSTPLMKHYNIIISTQLEITKHIVPLQR